MEYVQLGCFRRGSNSLHSILPGQGHSSSAILSIRKLETLGCPMVKTACFCIPSFGHNTEVWRTNRRICRSIYCACIASFVACCKKCHVHQFCYSTVPSTQKPQFLMAPPLFKQWPKTLVKTKSRKPVKGLHTVLVTDVFVFTDVLLGSKDQRSRSQQATIQNTE